MEIDPNDVTKAGPALGGVAALLGAIAGLFKLREQKRKELDARIDSKASSEDVSRALGHIEVLYKNAESDRRLMRDLHDTAIAAVRDAEGRILSAILTK